MAVLRGPAALTYLPGQLACGACGYVFAEEDAGPPVYECGTCGVAAVGEDGRQCQQCSRFAAKVSERSCPECEAGDDELARATLADKEQHDRDQQEAEEMKAKPRVESDAEKRYWAEQEAKKAEYREWWERQGRPAFAGLRDGDGRDLAAEIEDVVIEGGSLSFQFDQVALRAIGDCLPTPQQVCTERYTRGDGEERWRFVDEATGSVVRDDVAEEDVGAVTVALRAGGAEVAK